MGVTTNYKGFVAETKAIARATELGYNVSRPIMNARYDFILDDGEKLIRVQVKYADAQPSNCSGSVVVKLGYENRTGGVYTYKVAEVDALVVYVPKIDKLCIFPPSMFAGRYRMQLRYIDSKSNQKKGIIFTRDYLW